MVEIKNLVKKYGPKYALDDISFNINKGEILGFLGPNGAGKSTTMNIITGYLAPTSGTVLAIADKWQCWMKHCIFTGETTKMP